MTQEKKESVQLARCMKGDKVVRGKQYRTFGMRMPADRDLSDAVDWVTNYVDMMYCPEALQFRLTVTALERSDVGYRPMLIDSLDGDKRERVEITMGDIVLPDGGSAIQCPFHTRLMMNDVMAADFEEHGDSFTELPGDDKEEGTHDGIIEGQAILESGKMSKVLVDLTYLNDGIPKEELVLPQTELVIRCPDPYLAFDIMELVQDYIGPD